MKENQYAVIMAGGIGSRFWPVSTKQFPKQFHDMLGTGQSLLQKTFSRLNSFIPEKNIWVLTNERYTKLVLEQLPSATEKQLVLEPAMRNTAPCILLSALKIYKENPDGVMLVAPSDHWIEDEAAFKNDVLSCFEACEERDILMTLGIQPTFPNTGYGYIEFDSKMTDSLKEVKQFREKPDYETAKKFISEGNYLWNAGIFIWSAKSVIQAFKKYLPEMYTLFNEGFDELNSIAEEKFVESNYSKAENISIDYGVMEKADNVFVKDATFDWNDLGTWGALHEKLDKDNSGNAVVRAATHLSDASGNMIFTSGEKLVVVDGIDDYIIVDKENVLLLFPKSKEQHIKSLLKDVGNHFGENYT